MITFLCGFACGACFSIIAAVLSEIIFGMRESGKEDDR